MPNETWQSDFTHYRLADGTDVEILTWLDDHSRYALHVTAHHRVTGPIVLDTFRETAGQHGYPASMLTDNGMVYTTRFAGGRGGRNAARDRAAPPRHRPEELPPEPPHHLRQGRTLPADHQEVAARPTRPARHHRRAPGAARHASSTIYNHHRPHRSLPHRATPATAYAARPKATPRHRPQPATPTTASATTASTTPASVTLRLDGRLHHIGIGRTHARTHVIMLVHDLDIRIVHAATGELLRELTLDPTRDYQPTATTTRTTPQMTPAGPTIRRSAVADLLRDHAEVALPGVAQTLPKEGVSYLAAHRVARKGAGQRGNSNGTPGRIRTYAPASGGRCSIP